MDKAPAQLSLFATQKNQMSFSIAVGNVELMHEWFPKHLHMRIARMK